MIRNNPAAALSLEAKITTQWQTPPARSRMSAGHRRIALLGAMFLMATSAIGPGFITQTRVFTVQIGAAFAFAILIFSSNGLAWRSIGSW